MGTPLPGNTSQTARLLLGAPSYAVGWQEPVYLSDPAAGGTWSHVVDGRYWERLLAVRYVFSASAADATRYLELQLADAAGNVWAATPGGWGVVSGGTVTAYLALGCPYSAEDTSGDTFGWLPDLLVQPGWSWGMLVSGIDAGDQFSGVRLLVQRYPSDVTEIAAGA